MKRWYNRYSNFYTKMEFVFQDIEGDEIFVYGDSTSIDVAANLGQIKGYSS